MKAIETFYKGYKFRSRLEARWAVVFDSIGLSWEYEAEGFELPSGAAYLPDFEIVFPNAKKIYCEVKGAWLGDLCVYPVSVAGIEKVEEFAESSGEIIYLLGNVPSASLPCAIALCNGGNRNPFNPFSHMADFYGADIDAAFNAGRSARFEHGQKGGD